MKPNSTEITENFQRSIHKELGVEPTLQQTELLGALTEFVMSDTRAGFVLRGYAGTGKSTVVSALVRALKKIGVSSVLLAPTGRAAKVIASYSGMNAYTIHKKIYFKSINRAGYKGFQLAPNIHSNTLFVVDEASMLSDNPTQGGFTDHSILEDLIRYVRNGANCKVLFVGDVAQLPPVGSDDSPALSPKALVKFNIICEGYELTDVVRQSKDSGILFNATKIRTQISEEPEAFPQLETDFPDVIKIDGYDLQEALETELSRNGQRNVCLITKSNKRALAFNQEIRARVFWHEEKIVSGEQLMVVRNNYTWSDTTEIPFIANGDLIDVVRIHNYIDRYGFRFAEATVAFTDYKGSPEIEVLLLTDCLDQPHPGMPRELMKQLWENVLLEYQDEKNLGRRKKKAMENPYMNALHIKYGYAITCHKSQGGQWPVVFLDHGYLTDEIMGVNFLRWLYTAFTRATEKIYLVNFHKEFFPED